MALGLRQVRLPGFITRRQVNRKTFQRVVLRLRPLIRPIERVVRPRHEYVFAPGPERALGVFLFCVAVALFLPIPLSAYGPAIALFVTGFGLVERDGLVTLVGRRARRRRDRGDGGLGDADLHGRGRGDGLTARRQAAAPSAWCLETSAAALAISRLTPRAAWRMRCSFSTRPRRT